MRKSTWFDDGGPPRAGETPVGAAIEGDRAAPGTVAVARLPAQRHVALPGRRPARARGVDTRQGVLRITQRRRPHVHHNLVLANAQIRQADDIARAARIIKAGRPGIGTRGIDCLQRVLELAAQDRAGLVEDAERAGVLGEETRAVVGGIEDERDGGGEPFLEELEEGAAEHLTDPPEPVFQPRGTSSGSDIPMTMAHRDEGHGITSKAVRTGMNGPARIVRVRLAPSRHPEKSSVETPTAKAPTAS